MTLTERIATIEQARSTSNVVPLNARRVRRSVPRWIEYTRQAENRGKDLSGHIAYGAFVPDGSGDAA